MPKQLLPLITAAVAPTVAADATAGYFVGQEWLNTATNVKYLCTSAATGAAVWVISFNVATGSVATNSILGRITAGTGAVEVLTGANVRTICGLATTDAPTLAALTLTSALGILGSNGGSFAAGVWSRDANWGTFYRGHSGASADFALADASGIPVIHVKNGALGLGVTPVSGDGLLQLPSAGTTKAGGIGWGDTFLYRSAADMLTAGGMNLTALGIGGAPTHGLMHVRGARAGSTAGDIAILGGIFDGRSATGDGLRFRTSRLSTDATLDWNTVCFQIAREVDGTGNGSKVIFGPGWLGFSTNSTGNTTKMVLDAAGALILGTDPGGSELARIGGSVNLSTGSLYKINAVPVVGARRTGWALATGTATRTSFATGSVTVSALAEAVKALLDDFHATAGHGLLGT